MNADGGLELVRVMLRAKLMGCQSGIEWISQGLDIPCVYLLYDGE